MLCITGNTLYNNNSVRFGCMLACWRTVDAFASTRVSYEFHFLHFIMIITIIVCISAKNCMCCFKFLALIYSVAYRSDDDNPITSNNTTWSMCLPKYEQLLHSTEHEWISFQCFEIQYIMCIYFDFFLLFLCIHLQYVLPRKELRFSIWRICAIQASQVVRKMISIRFKGKSNISDKTENISM